MAIRCLLPEPWRAIRYARGEAWDHGQVRSRSNAWQSAITTLQEVQPPFIPEGAHAMTIVVEFPPGDPGAPPHRRSGPCFGHVLDGEMVFELEGEPARVVHAGEAFLEPGDGVIHYQNGNNRDDIPVRFTVTMLCHQACPCSPSWTKKSSPGVRTDGPRSRSDREFRARHFTSENQERSRT